jgi:hypothetical protein
MTTSTPRRPAKLALTASAETCDIQQSHGFFRGSIVCHNFATMAS